MKTNNYNYYYYVYCLIDMAKDIFGDDEYDWYSYDIAWDKGIELYETFQISKYNTSDKSELECINDFLNNLKTK